MRKNKSRGNGEGTIYKKIHQGKEVWVGQYTLYISKEGTQKRKTVYGKTRQEVKNKLDGLVTDLKTDKYVDKSNVTIRKISLQFIEDSYRLNRLGDSAYIRKKAIWVHLTKHYIADMEIQKIRESDIKDFLAYLTDFSQSVIDKAYGLLNNSFKRAIVKNIIKVNPLDDKLELAKPKSKIPVRKVRGFTIDEQKQFIEAVLKEFEVLQKNQMIQYKYQMLLSMYTGMRMGEVNALDKDLDINFKTKEITIRRSLTKDLEDKTIIGEDAKTDAGTDRVLHIDEQVEYLLKEYIDNYWVENKENLLFWDTRKDDLFSTSQVNLVFKRLCEKHKIAGGYAKTNQHQLRHTFATRNIEAGMPAVVLQKIMGHADLKTTLEIYCDVFAEYEREHTDRTYNYIQEKGLLIYNKPQTVDYNKENTVITE